MGEPRKIFRIEETAAARPADRTAGPQAPQRDAELMNEIAALRAMLARAQSSQSASADEPRRAEAGRLASELDLIARANRGDAPAHNSAASGDTLPIIRSVQELEEVVLSSEQATRKVLTAAEEIDQVAKSLAAALKGKFEQGLVQDIQDLVIRIFEACNFQDLAGQRINKVMAILNLVDDRAGSLRNEIGKPAAQGHREQFLHGPRLATDPGHVTQAEIDAIFMS
jgi:chemotaxis protein CheZ